MSFTRSSTDGPEATARVADATLHARHHRYRQWEGRREGRRVLLRRNRWHLVVSHADWNLPLPKLAGRITNVHDSADKFRTKFSDELNDIDHRDLEERLSHFKNKPDTFWEDNRADSAHTQVWEQKITTSQELFDLAYYGYELYKTFFPDNTKLRLWLDRLEPDWRVNITWLEGIDQHWVAHVPWSLLYVQPPVLGQPVDPMYFWGLRYRFNYLAHETMDTGLAARHRRPPRHSERLWVLLGRRRPGTRRRGEVAAGRVGEMGQPDVRARQ